MDKIIRNYLEAVAEEKILFSKAAETDGSNNPPFLVIRGFSNRSHQLSFDTLALYASKITRVIESRNSSAFWILLNIKHMQEHEIRKLMDLGQEETIADAPRGLWSLATQPKPRS